MIVLGIESSCDETAAAVVDDQGRVVADVVASQVALHAPYGGVVPELASRAHLEQIYPVIDAAGRSLPGGLADVDAVAVTNGPGLSGALLVGVQAAKALAFDLDVPLVGVNHLDGHLMAIFLQRDATPVETPEYPFIALLASGGHTALYRVDEPPPDGAELLGQTRDDAAGEAFDKCAKLLGLGYPGGPIIDRLAGEGDPTAFDLPLPMAKRSSLEFSFSGLKTAVARLVEREGVPEGPALADLCASFQRVAVESLVRKSMAACEAEGVPRLVLGGGVAANSGLRSRAVEVGEKRGVRVFVPPRASCTDNAAMIALAGVYGLRSGDVADLSLGAYTRDPARVRGKFRADGTHIPRKASLKRP